MSEKTVEAVAMAMAQKDAEDEGLKFPTSPTAYRTYMGLARAAIEAYERETAHQDMHDQRVTWEAVERMKFTPTDTPLMDAIKRGGYLDRVGKP